MTPANGAATKYDSRTIWFHWLTALLVAGQWVGAKTIDMWPKGALQGAAISTHITFGIVLGGLIAARIWWRATRGRRLPDVGGGVLPLLAKAMHWGLYLLILTVLALGLTMLSVHSFSYFNLFTLPSLTSNRALFRSVHSLHDLLATTILIAAGLHAVMALVHQYAWRNGVLARMIPQLG
jgi:cytochrome b561